MFHDSRLQLQHVPASESLKMAKVDMQSGQAAKFGEIQPSHQVTEPSWPPSKVDDCSSLLLLQHQQAPICANSSLSVPVSLFFCLSVCQSVLLFYLFPLISSSQSSSDQLVVTSRTMMNQTGFDILHIKPCRIIFNLFRFNSITNSYKKKRK